MLMKISAHPSAACLSAAAALCAFVASISYAHAASEQVKSACRDDYFRHCSAHAVDSPSLRQCMRNVGAGLSNPCIKALVLDGQITKDDIQRYQSHQEGGSKVASEQVAPKKGAIAGEIAKGNKAVTTSKATKVASVGKTANGGKAVTASKTTKVASVGKTANGGNAVTASKATKVASVGKSANGGKAATASKANKGAEPRLARQRERHRAARSGDR